MMQRLLERLDRRLKWTLIAPRIDGDGAEDEDRQRKHAALLRRAIEARAAAGLAREKHESGQRLTPERAWHLIATDIAGEVAGAVRLHVVDRHTETLEPEDVVRVSHVEFADPATREQHLLVLRQLFEQKADERYFVAAGGLFTAPPWRGSGLAAMLGVAAIAMARLHHSRFSASFTAARGPTQDLFAAFGGKPPLLPSGEPVAPFPCRHNGFDVQLMEFDSLHPEPRAEAGVQMLARRLVALMARREQCA